MVDINDVITTKIWKDGELRRTKVVENSNGLAYEVALSYWLLQIGCSFASLS